MIEVWNKRGNHLLNVKVDGVTVARDLNDKEAKAIVEEYKQQGHELKKI